jgi:hypothetical protein
MENDDLSLRTPINFVQARANTDPNTQYHLIKQLNPTSLWAQVGGDEFISKQEYVPAKIEVSEDFLIPLDARVAALNLSGDALKKYEDKYLQDKTRRESMIKAAADKAAADKAAADKAAADKAAELLAQQTAAAAKVAQVKKTTIACVKGKVTKKVTSVRPKCPTGYKVKK